MYYIMSIVNNIQASKNEFVEQLKKFIIDNGIIGTAAGVSIALVTKDVIQSLVGDIIIPSICALLLRLNITYITSCLPGKTNFDITNFIKQSVSWVFVIIITFLFIKITFNSLLGINDTSQDTKKEASTKETSTKDKTKESFFGGGYY